MGSAEAVGTASPIPVTAMVAAASVAVMRVGKDTGALLRDDAVVGV
ncbi:hypothetical protein [Rhodococcus sp. IEGM 1379]|nr:hypothetical protein [Rhodococcus sp. IEGM 1379]MDI9917321.1 hypothetical protein [Rhodococcus sp. IEGM 1379]